MLIIFDSSSSIIGGSEENHDLQDDHNEAVAKLLSHNNDAEVNAYNINKTRKLLSINANL